MDAKKWIRHTRTEKKIFDTMSDGIVTIDASGKIRSVNAAFRKIFQVPEEQILTGNSFEKLFLTNKKNVALKKYYHSLTEKNVLHDDAFSITYRTEDGGRIPVEIYVTEGFAEKRADSSELTLLIKDKSTHIKLRQNQRDCAFIFSGLIFCITTYLMAWSCIRFTLKIRLSTSVYTLIIEGITFLLFLEIIFMTSFSMSELGLLPKRVNFLRNLKETLILMLSVSAFLFLQNGILFLTGHNVKSHFLGGSFSGASNYLLTAFVQEFLARGVIQNCVKTLLRVKYQKFFSILLTSLLFSLMHMPFGFIFMMGAFVLSLVLGIIYERHGNLWGCFLLHWVCGYLTMCMFF